MIEISRRHALKTLASAPLAAGCAWTAAEAHTAHRRATEARRLAIERQVLYAPQFFTAHEYASVTRLANTILPADERSGSAGDAGVPEFIDFMMIDQPARQLAMRGGLAWLDAECEGRFDARFVNCSDAQRAQMLDDIAWPDRAPTTLSHGVEFFTIFRDLTATGFWTSRMGIDDLQYRGNEYLVNWAGCPDEALSRLGVDYGND